MEAKELPDCGRLETFLNVISESSEHMQNLIVDLLDYANPGDVDEALERVDTGEVLDYALSNLQERLEVTGAVISKGELPYVEAHSLRLSRVFQNIVANSLKYVASDVRPQVTVANEITPTGNLLSFKDNGIGMEEKHVPKIFEPFKRLVTRSEYSGTGMGLSICKRIVESYDGKIWAESELGVGTTIFILLPLCEQSPPNARLEDLEKAA